jgi:hypothetical protein
MDDRDPTILPNFELTFALFFYLKNLKMKKMCEAIIFFLVLFYLVFKKIKKKISS